MSLVRSKSGNRTGKGGSNSRQLSEAKREIADLKKALTSTRDEADQNAAAWDVGGSQRKFEVARMAEVAQRCADNATREAQLKEQQAAEALR